MDYALVRWGTGVLWPGAGRRVPWLMVRRLDRGYMMHQIAKRGRSQRDLTRARGSSLRPRSVHPEYPGVQMQNDFNG